MVEKITDINGLGNAMASKLAAEADVSNLGELADADPEKLSQLDGISKSRAQQFIDKAKESTVMIQSGDEVRQSYDDIQKISTGIPELNDYIGGGWEAGHAVAIAGETGSGKTQLTFQALGEAVKQTGKPAVYIETERGRYRGDRIIEMYDERIQEKVYKVGAYDLDQQKMAYEKIKSEFTDLSAVAVDSFTSRFRMSGDYESREDMSARSNEFAKHLTSIEKLAAQRECPVLMTCQVYGNPTAYGGNHVVYGGSLMMHTVNFICMLKDRTGQLMELEIMNHPNVQDQSMELRVTDDGVEFMTVIDD